MITWDADTMSTGIPMIDAQHKMLFQKFNEFSATFSISPESSIPGSRWRTSGFSPVLCNLAFWTGGELHGSIQVSGCR